MPHKFDPAHLAELDRPDRAEWQGIDAFLAILEPKEGGAYADLGCGVGYFSFPVAERIGPRGTMYALDVQPAMLKEVRRRAKERGLTNVLPILSSEREIPLPNASVDALWTVNTFHEMEAPLDILRETRRVLRRAGRVVVIDWKKEETPMGPPLEERIPAAVIVRTLEEARFQDVGQLDAYPYHAIIVGTR